MLKFLFLFFLLIFSTAYASPLDDLKKQTKEPLYFSVPIQSYKIVKKGNNINLKVKLSPYSITAMTDRPYRQKKAIRPEEFISYIREKQQKDLIFTLTIQQNGQPFIINFKKQNTVYSASKDEVVFENIQIPKNVSDQIGDIKSFKGANAVLIVEG
ncbi:MAG: hypothetical protein BGO67_01300 [Alphaproteobacteria bacterium 41-28]|nr:MAG: hypothetical protein BGO67_01300 [Alphaproteobacteria bacterium 41-28]